MSILGRCAWNCLLAQRLNGKKMTHIQATKHFYPPKLSCGGCSWHALIPRQCPGSVWRRINWPVPKTVQSILWRFNSVDAPAMVPRNRSSPWYKLVYWHRQKRTLLPPRWVSLGQECYILGFYLYFHYTKRKCLPLHTHTMTVSSHTYCLEWSLWFWNLEEEAALLLEPPSPLQAGFTFTCFFFYTDQSCLDNDTVKARLSILTCTSSAQSGFILCIPLWVPVGDACCPLFRAWSGPHVTDYVSSFWKLIQTKLKVLV